MYPSESRYTLSVIKSSSADVVDGIAFQLALHLRYSYGEIALQLRLCCVTVTTSLRQFIYYDELALLSNDDIVLKLR